MGKCIYGRKKMKIVLRESIKGKEEMYSWFKGGKNELQYSRKEIKRIFTREKD